MATEDSGSKQKTAAVAPHIALLSVQAFFGTLPVIGKLVLAVIPSVALVGFRVGITAIVLYAFQRTRGSLELADRKDYGRLAVLSVFGVTLNQLLFVGGLSLTKAANTSLLAVTIPIFAIAIGAYFGTERMRLRKVAGILIAAAGVIFLIDPRSASFSSQTTLGDVMIILNSFSYGIYVVRSKDVVTRNGALRSIVWIFIFASMICVPLGIVSLSTIDVAAVQAHIWWLVVYIAIVATTAPYLLNAWALARVNPSTVVVYIYLQPLIGFVSAVVFLGEKIDLKFAAAALLVFSGVYMTTKRRKHADTAARV